MKALFGVCNNNVLTVNTLVKNYAKAKGIDLKIQVLGFDERVKKSADVILISTLTCFTKNRAALKNTDAVVILFDTPMLLEYLSPITLLDVLEKKLSYMYVYKPLVESEVFAAMDNALKSTKRIKMKREQFDVIPTMLNSQLSTILNPIQTYLYGVRDTDKRLQYQKLVYTWLVSGASVQALEKTMVKAIGGEKKPVGLKRLLETLDQEGFLRMRNAFKEAFDSKVANVGEKKKKSVNVKALAKKYNVDPFDIRYTLNALRKHGSFQVINRDVRDIYKEHVAKSKARRAKTEDAEV